MAELRRALVVGATGLVGQHLCAVLSKSPEYNTVNVMLRRAVSIPLPKVAVHLVDFDNLQDDHPAFQVDDVYIALGTTMSTVKSKDLFRIIDQYYPKIVTRFAVENGATRVMVVSALGAAPDKRNFYLSVKGDMEESVRRCEAPFTAFFRPSLIVGKRSEFRPLERLGALAMQLGLAPFKSLKKRIGPIGAGTIAKAMVATALQHDTGVEIIENERIRRLAKEV